MYVYRYHAIYIGIQSCSNVIQIVKFHIGMIQPNNKSKFIPVTLLLDEVSEKTYGTYLQMNVDPDVIL